MKVPAPCGSAGRQDRHGFQTARKFCHDLPRLPGQEDRQGPRPPTRGRIAPRSMAVSGLRAGGGTPGRSVLVTLTVPCRRQCVLQVES
eukprot:632958-Hanusia_phi.AAC.1